MALLQKWRENYGPNATYRNLAKSFYDAGRPDLVETVCVVMTCDYPANTSQQFPLSLSYAMADATAAVFSASFSSFVSIRFCYWLSFAVVVLSVILASNYLEADNSQNGNHSGPQSCTEIGSTYYGQKTSDTAPNNLPHFPGRFVGRDKEIEYITRLLHFANHSHTNMVHIFGLPAVGKSTLAIHVGYEMARRGVAVRYINADETHIFKSREHNVTASESHGQGTTSALSETVSDIELSWYSHTEKKHVSTSPEGLLQWAKGLSNDTILIIDNCDPLLQSDVTQKEFVRMFSDLNIASRFLHIVSTSRLKVRLLDGFKLYKLKPLDNESAIELLMSLSDVITLNDSRTVNGLVGGIPLALKIVGSLVSETELPNLIIRELSENLIKTLTPEGTGRLQTGKMRPVLELSFKYLDTSTQECAVYLSHFTGSFSHEAALHILSKCTNSSPVEHLTNLTDRSLLDRYSYAGQHRYQFHRLIKEYLMDIDSHQPYAKTLRIATRFNSSFLVHYT